MSLPPIARELYRFQRQVDQLEKELAESTPVEKEALKLKLAQAKSERDQMRRILDGRLNR